MPSTLPLVPGIFEWIREGKYENTKPYAPGISRPPEVKRREYRAEEARLQALFKADLFRCYGVEDHPKAEDAWRIAYERGHSAGYSEIANEFDEIVVLIKP